MNDDFRGNRSEVNRLNSPNIRKEIGDDPLKHSCFLFEMQQKSLVFSKWISLGEREREST